MNIGLILHLMFQTQSDPDKEYPKLQDKQVVKLNYLYYNEFIFEFYQ